MIRKIAYWSSTTIVAVMLLFALSYAGATFALAMAVVAHYSAGDGVQVWSMPLALLALLIVSYVTRPASRRLMPLRATRDLPS
jgi:Na+(H+)/acetate symporter ActP